jgi:hypothetical protein
MGIIVIGQYEVAMQLSLDPEALTAIDDAGSKLTARTRDKNALSTIT